MTLKKHWNTTVLCVDSEENILNAYKDILSNVSYNCNTELKNISNTVKTLLKNVANKETTDLDAEPISYNVLTAKTQKEAISIIEEQKLSGNQIAVIFFDIHLSHEDGLKVLEKSKELMPEMLSCIVSPHTSKHERALSKLFKTSSEWMCMSKPFSKHQLIQNAFHMVSAWNLKQEREDFEADLSLILKLIHNIDNVDVLANDANYEKTLLQNILDFLNIDKGVLLVNKQTGISVEQRLNFDEDTLPLTEMIAHTKNVIKTKQFIEAESFLYLPLSAKSLEAAVVIPKMELTWIKQNMLYIFLTLIASNAEQVLHAKNDLSRDLEKCERNFTIMQSIASTLCHHINNPLAIVKGFAEMTMKHTDNNDISKNMLKIAKASENIAGIVEILSSLNETDANNIIDTQIGIQMIDIESQVTAIRNLIDAKYEEKEKQLEA